MSISALAFLTLFLSLSLLCIVRNPFYGVLMYELNYFLNPVVRWWYWELPNLRWSFSISLLLIIGFVIHYKKFTDNRLFEVPTFKWLTGLTVLCLLAYVWAVNPDWHDKLTIRYLKYIIVVMFFYKIISTKKEFDLFLCIYVLGVFYICWVGWTVGRTGGARLEGIGASDGSEVNGTAALVVTAVPILIHTVLFVRKNWVKGLALITSAFVLNGLVLLNSRGAFIATVISAAWFTLAVFREKGIVAEKKKLVWGLIGGCLLFLYLSDDVFWDRMSTLKDTDAETGSGHRMLYWAKTFDMLKDHPLGLGGDGYMWLSPQYLPPEWLSRGLRTVHSTWFEVLSGLGFQGFLVFMGYILSTFYLSKKTKRYLKDQGDQFRFLQLVALEASFIAFLVAATFINRFYSEPMYWLPALISAYANIYMLKPMNAGSQPAKP